MTPRPGGFWSEKTNTQPFPPKRKFGPVDYAAWLIWAVKVAVLKSDEPKTSTSTVLR